jgi:CMP-N,N'-diacetyllegionaminic acid synthase
MYKNKTFLAIIPARSGSKGIIDKNIKELNNKPLMAHTIEACVNSKMFDEIIVSTDSVKYAEIASKYGASVPFLRPGQLSSDEAATKDVIVHVLNEMKHLGRVFDYFMLLQPTSPLRNETHILESINILFKQNADSVISICKAEYPACLNVYLLDTGELKVSNLDTNQIRRQDQPQEYRINGAIYLVDTKVFQEKNSFYSGKTFPYLMDEISSIDIDESFQFQLAEYFMTH